MPYTSSPNLDHEIEVFFILYAEWSQGVTSQAKHTYSNTEKDVVLGPDKWEGIMVCLCLTTYLTFPVRFCCGLISQSVDVF